MRALILIVVAACWRGSPPPVVEAPPEAAVKPAPIDLALVNIVGVWTTRYRESVRDNRLTIRDDGTFQAIGWDGEVQIVGTGRVTVDAGARTITYRYEWLVDRDGERSFDHTQVHKVHMLQRGLLRVHDGARIVIWRR